MIHLMNRRCGLTPDKKQAAVWRCKVMKNTLNVGESA